MWPGLLLLTIILLVSILGILSCCCFLGGSTWFNFGLCLCLCLLRSHLLPANEAFDHARQGVLGRRAVYLQGLGLWFSIKAQISGLGEGSYLSSEFRIEYQGMRRIITQTFKANIIVLSGLYMGTYFLIGLNLNAVPSSRALAFSDSPSSFWGGSIDLLVAVENLLTLGSLPVLVELVDFLEQLSARRFASSESSSS